MSENSKKNLYFQGGVPTAPDVKLIRTKYPDKEMVKNKVIPYQDIEKLIKQDRKTSRFQSVTTSWRKTIQKELGIVIEPDGNGNFIVLNDSDLVGSVIKKQNSLFRQTRKNYKRSALVDRLMISEQEKRQLDFFQNRTSKFLSGKQIRSLEAPKNKTDNSNTESEN